MATNAKFPQTFEDNMKISTLQAVTTILTLDVLSGPGRPRQTLADPPRRVHVDPPRDPSIAAWNAAVDRKKAEKRERQRARRAGK
jgi:hypothetical protein